MKPRPITLKEAKKIERKWAGRVFRGGGVTKDGKPLYIVSPK